VPRCRQIKLCQRHSVAVLSVPSNSCRSLSIPSPHIGPRADPGRAVLRRVLITSGYFTAQPGPPRVNDRQRPSASSTTSNDQQRPATIIQPTQRLTLTYHDHESRSSSSIITKPTHSSSLQPTDRTLTRMLITLDGSGIHRQRTTLAHTALASSMAQFTTLCRMKRALSVQVPATIESYVHYVNGILVIGGRRLEKSLFGFSQFLSISGTGRRHETKSAWRFLISMDIWSRSWLLRFP